jgi:hypothetical protein
MSNSNAAYVPLDKVSRVSICLSYPCGWGSSSYNGCWEASIIQDQTSYASIKESIETKDFCSQCNSSCNIDCPAEECIESAAGVPCMDDNDTTACDGVGWMLHDTFVSLHGFTT